MKLFRMHLEFYLNEKFPSESIKLSLWFAEKPLRRFNLLVFVHGINVSSCQLQWNRNI